MRLLPKREEDPLKRKRSRIKRLAFYGGLILGLTCAYLWQPIRFDLIPRRPPNPNPLVDPDPAALFAKGTRIVVVTAHPDDSEYYLAPLLLRLREAGADLHHLLLTDGDKGYMPWQNAVSNSQTRQAEQRAASAEWGADTITFLGYKDGRLSVHPDTIAAAKRELEKVQPDYVLGFDPDYPPRISHGDHRRAGSITVAAVKAMKNKPRFLLLYSTEAPNYFADVSKTWTQGLELLAHHKSQWTGDKLQRVKNSVSDDWITTGEKSGLEAAIGLRVVQYLEEN